MSLAQVIVAHTPSGSSHQSQRRRHPLHQKMTWTQQVVQSAVLNLIVEQFRPAGDDPSLLIFLTQ